MTENIESKCMVLGDLNARVGNVPDFISSDEADSFINHADWYTPDYFNNRRHSKDNTLNKFGKSLIDLCWEMNMRILNGRCKGDEDGEITFVAAQGKSVIDYVIVETELYSYCAHFQIIDYDSCSHFPISVYMSFIEQMYSSNRDSQKYTKQIKFRWAAEKADEFLHKLNDEHSQYQLSLLGNEVVRDVNNDVAILVNVIHRAAESMAISRTFTRSTSHRLPRWWNENCSKQKVIKNKLLNRFRMTNTTSDLNNYLTAKKYFRNVCKEAQKTDQEFLTIQLCDSVDDTCFWKHIISINSKGNVIENLKSQGQNGITTLRSY